MMSVAVMGMLVPAVYHQLAGKNLTDAQLPNIETMSLIISGVLILNYVCGLVFSLKTHRDLYNGGEGQADAADYVTAGVGEIIDEPRHARRPVWAAVTMLVLATTAVAVASELLVATLEPVMHKLKMSELFTGAVIIAIIGNAAEHSTAIIVAWRNKMDLAMQICIGSSMQVALFVTPALVFISLALGKPMTLEFTAVEILSVFGAVFVVTTIANDGESNWFEGVQLITLYAVMAVAFYFL
jgi:Ca2+:H+ antiporter